MITIIAITALLISSLNAAEQVDKQDGQQVIPFKGNWTETFRLKNGDTVEHKPNYVKMGFMQGGTGLHINSKTYNGLPMSSVGLQLDTNSTREEFLKALIASDLYQDKK